MLRHNASRSPGCILVIEAFVGGSNRLLVRVRHSRLIKTRQVGKSVIAGGRHDPGIAAFSQVGVEAIVVLKNQRGLRAHFGQSCAPAYRRIREVHVELGDHRLPVDLHVCRRWEIGFLDVLKIVHQCLLWRTSLARIPLNRSLVDHDRKGEPGMRFRLRHDLKSGLIQRISRTIPVENYAVNSTAHHVIDLALHLVGVGGVVANVHMVRLSEP